MANKAAPSDYVKNSTSREDFPDTETDAVIATLNRFYDVVGNKPVEPGSIAMMALYLLKEATPEQIENSLHRCIHESKGFPIRLPDIVQRLSTGGDERPEPENAWAMCPKSDDSSVVWTEEMATAFDGARHLMLDGDIIGARMAFKEAYAKELAKARSEGLPVRWMVSLGWDWNDRIRAMSEAVTKGRLSVTKALELAAERYDEMRMALPESEQLKLEHAERKQLAGEIQNHHGTLPTPLQGLHSMLQMIRKEMPELVPPPPPAPIPKRSTEEQLCHLQSLPLSEEQKRSIQDVLLKKLDQRGKTPTWRS